MGASEMALDLGVDPESAATVKWLEMPMHDPRADDRLPRILTEAYSDGACAGFSPDLEEPLNEYYDERGWDRNH